MNNYNYLILEDNQNLKNIKVIARTKDLKEAHALKDYYTKENKVFYKICVIVGCNNE